MLAIALQQCFSHYYLDKDDGEISEIALVRSSGKCGFDKNEDITVSVMLQMQNRIVRMPYYTKWEKHDIEIDADLGHDSNIFAVFVHSDRYVEQVTSRGEYMQNLFFYVLIGVTLVAFTFALSFALMLCFRYRDARKNRVLVNARMLPGEPKDSLTTTSQESKLPATAEPRGVQNYPQQVGAVESYAPIMPPVDLYHY